MAGGDGAALLALLAKIKDKAEHQLGRALRLVVIQEAGRDGFWIHRLLEAAAMERINNFFAPVISADTFVNLIDRSKRASIE